MKIIITLLMLLTLSFTISAQSKVVPIIDVKVGGLLGGVQNGKWLDAKTTFEMLSGEGSYTLFGIKGNIGELTLTVEKPDEPCEDFYYAKNELEDKQGVAIGTSRNWNVVPQTPTALNLTDKTYMKIVSDILRSKGLTRAKARIEQAVRVDLDGDGINEVILTASSYAGNIQPNAKVGDYSFVLLRKIVGGKVKNIMIAEEYIKNKIDYGIPSHFEVSAIADLNGDGKMEIVLFGEYYEGSGASVYEIKSDKLMKIKELETGCGV
ncbi:hypothetical protein BH10ACI1_BH10ACI1_28000 [soil metagenome]